MSFDRWEYRTLGKLTVKIGSGVTPRGGNSVYSESGIPLVRSQNIYNCSFSDGGLAFIDEEQADKMKNVLLEQNDVLLNITGDSVARCTKVPKHCVGGRVNQHVAIIRTDENLLNSDFLKYYLVSSDMQLYMLSLARMGATRAALTKTMIESFEIPIPQINEQKAIAHTLSTFDEKIEVNNQINKTLEAMAQALFKRWFIDFEFPNENGEPYKSSGGEMVESELGLIPKGWEVIDIDTATEVVIDHRGKTPKKLGSDWSEKGIIALSAKCIKNGRLINLEQANHVDSNLYEQWMKEELKYGDILLTSEAPLGEMYFMATNDKYCLSQRLYALRADVEKMLPEVLYMYMQSEKVYQDIMNRATGTTVTGIRQSELRKVLLIKPDIKRQREYSVLASEMLQNISLNERKNRKLGKVRDTLLPKLMSGEIRVPIEDN
jgi:type I restriction enzyme S subunit